MTPGSRSARRVSGGHSGGPVSPTKIIAGRRFEASFSNSQTRTGPHLSEGAYPSILTTGRYLK